MRRHLVAVGLSILFGLLAHMSAAAQDTIRFGTALSLTGNLATERKLVREGYDFFVNTVNERGGIGVAGTLSGGEQQMCAIGRALMASPKLLIVDEVTLGLAPLVVESLFVALKELHRQGMALLTVEQNVPLVFAHSDRGCVLSGGAIVLEGPAGILRDDPDLPRHFIG